MHRLLARFRSRGSSALALAAFLLASPAAGAAARACPHDERHVAHAETATGDVRWFCGPEAAASDPTQQPDAPCRCVGPCHVPPAAPPPSAPVVAQAPVRPAPSPVPVPARAPRGELRRNLLPWPHAPPAAPLG